MATSDITFASNWPYLVSAKSGSDTEAVSAVKRLEKRLADAESLAGEMMATLVINRDRHEFDAMPRFSEWCAMIDRWRDKHAKIGSS